MLLAMGSYKSLSPHPVFGSAFVVVVIVDALVYKVGNYTVLRGNCFAIAPQDDKVKHCASG